MAERTKLKTSRTAMGVETEASRVFAALRAILERRAGSLAVVKDEPGEYSLETRSPVYRGRPLFYGMVKAGKSYVSFHLIAVYGCPRLLEGASDKLKRRKQGKSCFNFTAEDPELFQELADLEERAFRHMQPAIDEGRLPFTDASCGDGAGSRHRAARSVPER